MLSVYQAELPAHGSRAFSGLFVKSCLWGRRRDVHTVLGWFEPGLQAPLAKAYTAFQACTLASYVTAVPFVLLGLTVYINFQRERAADSQERSFFGMVFPGLSGSHCEHGCNH